MKKIILLIITTVIINAQRTHAQTDPVPFNMNANGNYSFTSWSPSSTAGTYPANMIFHTMGPTAPISLTSVASSDITGVYSNNNGTRINGLNNDGISLANETKQTSTGYEANRNGEIVIALNTTDRTNITLSFTAGTYATGTGSSVSRLRAQYRIQDSGTWGAWKEISTTPVEYTSSLIAPSSQNFSGWALPSETDNQANVQIRWIFYYDSGTMNNGYKSPVIRLDDILVTSQPIVSFVAPGVVCMLNNAAALSGGIPAGGTFSGPYVSSNSFNASAAGPGSYPVNYTYTDSHGISNTASANVIVDLLSCNTQLTPAYCGATNLNLNQNIFTSAIPGAADYEFEFVNQSNGNTIIKNRGNSNPVIFLGSVPGLNYGSSYNVRVRFRVGNSWSGFGNSCTINMQNTIPLTSLVAANCGATNLSLNSTIYTAQITGAADYEFEFTNAITGSVITKNRGNSNPLIYLGSVPGLQYGATYNVRVKSLVAGVWSQYGSSCSITLQSLIPSSQLTLSSCGAAGLTLNHTIYTTIVSGATDYEFQFVDQDSGAIITKNRGNSNPLMYLGDVPGLAYNSSYNVTVRAKVAGVWGPFGSSCAISLTSSIPLTQLASVSCGSSGLLISDYIYIDKVAGATNYEYLFSCGSFPFSQYVIRGNNTNHLPLSMVNGLLDGYTYQVQVRSFVGGSWSSFGPVCDITVGTVVRSSEIISGTTSADSHGFSIYPNPSNGIMHIRSLSEDSFHVQVFNMKGQLILDRQVFADHSILDLTNNQKGIYIIRMESSDKVYYEKISITE